MLHNHVAVPPLCDLSLQFNFQVHSHFWRKPPWTYCMHYTWVDMCSVCVHATSIVQRGSCLWCMYACVSILLACGLHNLCTRNTYSANHSHPYFSCIYYVYSVVSPFFNNIHDFGWSCVQQFYIWLHILHRNHSRDCSVYRNSRGSHNNNIIHVLHLYHVIYQGSNIKQTLTQYNISDTVYELRLFHSGNTITPPTPPNT